MLTPAKAAKKAGVSRGTIMNALKNRDLKATRNNRNHWQIQDEDLSKWMAGRGDIITDMPVSEPDTELSGQIQVLQAELRGRDALIEQLRSDLDHARLPFWRKILGKI